MFRRVGAVLIVLPPSESKRPPPDSGPALRMDGLSFPELTPIRRRVLQALIETSGQPDALERLRVRPTLIGEVTRNTVIRELPTRAASETYSGALHAALDAASLTGRARQRLDSEVVINSALWGLLRPIDQIPAYRLHVCNHLIGAHDLEPLWRSALPELLAEASSGAVVLDLRSPTYQAAGTPARLDVATVTVRVLPEPGARSIGDVIGKRVRGQVARYLLEEDETASTPDDLADVLGERWPVRLEPPAKAMGSWTIALRPAD
jgi:cytoplasmic iron level regulating protein YaaA (DUF328/UPF0246 family)